MNELIIKSHDFSVALTRLKELSEREGTDLDFKTVDTSKDFGEWVIDCFTGMGIGTKHIVTGSELNELTNKIQANIIALNNEDKKNNNEIREIYNALAAIDKDYIQIFIMQLESIRETQERNDKTQNDVKKIVDDQKKTLVVLKKFKSKVEAIEHLCDIDDLWNYCQKWQETISLLTNSIQNIKSCNNEHAHEIENIKNGLKSTEEQILGLLNNLNQHIEKLNAVIDFKNELEKSIHLNDIDEMYDSLENLNSSLISIKEEFDSIKSTILEQKSNIDNLLLFMDEISKFEHLKDIDDIWNKNQEQQLVLSETQSNVASNTENIAELKKRYVDAVGLIQSNKKYIDELNKIEHLRDADEIWRFSNAHSSQLSELEKKNDEINNIIQQNKETADATISDMIEKNDSFIYTLTKKIKYAYILAGSSLGIAIIELIMILLKVI